jgi:hypothetical protein
LPDLIFLAFLKPFFLLAAGSQIFLSLSEVAVFSAELSLVFCLPPHHHHRHFHVYLVLQAVLEFVLPSQLLLSREPQVLLFVLGL